MSNLRQSFGWQALDPDVKLINYTTLRTVCLVPAQTLNDYIMEKRGMILIEVLVTLAIILGLMASAYKIQQWVVVKRDELRVGTDLSMISQRLEEYRLFNGDYPYVVNDDEDMILLGEDLGLDESLLRDPWGNVYRYQYKSSKDSTYWVLEGYKLWSPGPDGKTTEIGFECKGSLEDVDNLVYY